MKNVFITIGFCGFIYALGIIGSCDYEFVTGTPRISDMIFNIHTFISGFLLVVGIVGVNLIPDKAKCKTSHRAYKPPLAKRDKVA